MSKKVLVIDDDRTLSKLVQGTLSLKGYQVTIAYDGEEGLEKLRQEKPDLIVLDVHMPKVNGYAFLLEAKEIVDLKTIPVIVLTAKEGMEEIFKTEGVREYLVKPFDPEKLLQVVERYIK